MSLTKRKEIHGPTTPAELGEAWRDWPRNVFVPGDIVLVKWCYLGVNGYVMHEDFHLLLDLKETGRSSSEIWDTCCCDQNGNCTFTEISCYDYRNATDEEWHEVTLIARADGSE